MVTAFVGVNKSIKDAGTTMIFLSDDAVNYELHSFVIEGQEKEPYPLSSIENGFVVYGEYNIGDTIEIR